MKKTFIKPEVKTMAMQTENIMQSASFTQGDTSKDGPAPLTADSKRGVNVGAISATTFAWN